MSQYSTSLYAIENLDMCECEILFFCSGSLQRECLIYFVDREVV